MQNISCFLLKLPYLWAINQASYETYLQMQHAKAMCLLLSLVKKLHIIIFVVDAVQAGRLV